MNQQARQMRQLLYPLKRERGKPVQVHQINANSPNLETGAITKSYTTHKVKKAIVLPVDGTRNFVYDLAFIAANKNFTGGGLFDKNRTNVIIDMKELPNDVEITLDDYCTIVGNQTYKIAAANIFEDAFYILQLTTLTNAKSLEVE